MKCLAKRPADRWQQVEELLHRLDHLEEQPGSPWASARPRRRPIRIAVAAAVIAAALLGASLWRAARGRPGATARELFIVAEFANRTRDPTLGTLVAERVRDQLAESPGLASVGNEPIAAARRRMRLPLGAPLTGDAARELAVREEIRLVVDGRVTAAGPGFVLSARIVEAASGNVVHAAAAMARDSTDIAAAIERLGRGLRKGLGEPLAASPAPTGALWSYTTSSLPALENSSPPSSHARAATTCARSR